MKKAIEVLQSVSAIIKTTTSFTQQNAEELGLTLHQLSILNTLYSFPNLTLKEVTEKLQSSKSTISVNVEGLVQLGLVERKSSIEDRREVKLNLTNAGKVKSRQSSQNAYSYRAMVQALDKMNDEDVEQLLVLNKELFTNLQQVVIE